MRTWESFIVLFRFASNVTIENKNMLQIQGFYLASENGTFLRAVMSIFIPHAERMANPRYASTQ